MVVTVQSTYVVNVLQGQPEKRIGQRCLADEVTQMVHGSLYFLIKVLESSVNSHRQMKG